MPLPGDPAVPALHMRNEGSARVQGVSVSREGGVDIVHVVDGGDGRAWIWHPTLGVPAAAQGTPARCVASELFMSLQPGVLMC